jgi:putative FmdB family regulatory protein
MPTYSYLCERCGSEFERFQAITAKPLRMCPKCGKKRLKRLIGSGAGIIFKGSGFYQTDYRSESYKKAEKSEKMTTTKDAAEKKPETKSKEPKPVKKDKSTPTEKK